MAARTDSRGLEVRLRPALLFRRLLANAGPLTAENSSLEPSDPHSISAGLPPDAGASVHRAASPTIPAGAASITT